MSITTKTPQSLWAEILGILKDNVNPQSYKTWFEPIKPLKLTDTTLTIEVPSHFFIEWIEEHYVNLMRKALRRLLGPDAKLIYSYNLDSTNPSTIQSTVNLPTQSNEYSITNPPVSVPLDSSKQAPNPFIIPGLKKLTIESQLNPYYTFETFVEAPSNRIARTTGLSIAQRPGKNSFNPIFIHGGTGLGKTHLCQAIGNEIKRLDPSKVVLYVSLEKFANQYVEAAKAGNVPDFLNFYQALDVLIVDDIQFLANKDRTQEAMFHIFNHLHQKDKQLIFTSDCQPQELKSIEERLISRFSWGLTCELTLPDPEVRKSILVSKMHNEGLNVPEDVVDFLAYNIATNIRELEGALISLIAQNSFGRKEINIDLARHIVKNFVKSSSREISIETIMKIVSEYFQINPEKLKEKTRKREFVQARQISMYFAKNFTKASLKMIGQHFGGRDHSTVIHALQTVNDLMSTDRNFQKWVEDIQKKIQMTSS
jgi:chromosomal replication initiator protein